MWNSFVDSIWWAFEVEGFFLNRDDLEVAVVYYRAGYSPKHYPTEKV